MTVVPFRRFRERGGRAVSAGGYFPQRESPEGLFTNPEDSYTGFLKNLTDEVIRYGIQMCDTVDRIGSG